VRFDRELDRCLIDMDDISARLLAGESEAELKNLYQNRKLALAAL